MGTLTQRLPASLNAPHRQRRLRLCSICAPALLLALAGLSSQVLAAPLSLSESPLFLGTSSEPNIMLLVDDSGSMDWNTVTPDESGTMHISCTSGSDEGKNYGYTHEVGDEIFGSTSVNGGRVPTDKLVNDVDSGVPNNQGMWRAWNPNYNSLYYDYTVRYLPWAGNDSGGTAFGNADPASIRKNPRNPSTAAADRYNLTTDKTYSSDFACNEDQAHNVTMYPARYFTWTDSDSDGQVDPNEQNQYIEIRPTGSATCSGANSNDGVNAAVCPTTFSGRPATRTDCADVASGNCTRTEELQNFANWFQYYRRREYTAKAAFGQVAFNSSGVRMGLATLHNNNTVNRAIRDLDLSSNKATLLDEIYQIGSTGGTPLLTAVNNCMLYLDCNDTTNPYSFQHNVSGDKDDIDNDGNFDTLSNSCPALTAAKGGACQQNFLIAMTDGFYNTSNPNVGNWDADGSSVGTAGTTEFDGGAYADSRAHTLADITMKYYESDIQPNLANNVPAIPGLDSNNKQHVVTYTVAFGVDGTIGPNQNTPGQVTNAKGMPASSGTAFSWPNPGVTTSGTPNLDTPNPEKIDDLRHAAYNGRGEFLSAKKPNELVDALLTAINDIADRTSSASSVALNSGSLNISTRVFQARFDSSDWTGELLAFPVSAGPGTSDGCTGEAEGVLCPLAWNAADVLNAQNWDTGRVIITRHSNTKAGIPFRWASLHSSQQNALCDNPDTTGLVEICVVGPLTTAGQSRLEYLRGRRDNEGAGASNFRIRQTVLGDMVNSDPFFAGAPNSPYDTEAGYAAFRSSYINRTPMVYVGANDGMLHGFRVSDGRELLAYVPSEVNIYKDLPRLTAKTYGTPPLDHRYFVDGSPAIGDAYFDSDNSGSSEWRTVLIETFRAGGQGVVALDVTDPSQFTEANADSILLWEFNQTDDADLGFTHGRASIVKMANGKWAALVGNGYNNSVADGNASSTGRGYLFILYLDGPGADGVWNLGTDYRKIEVNAGSTTTPNGLASPSGINIDEDLEIEYVYAGDLEGNMWRFDVTSASPGSWTVATNPIFRACSASPCSTSNRQPITSKPEAGPHPDGLPATHGLIVYFGTGRYLAVGDNNPAGAQTQTFYGVWDQLGTQSPAQTFPVTRDDLAQQQIIKEVRADGTACVVEASDCFRISTTNAVNLTADNDLGWYMDLYNTNEGASTANLGERTVSDSILRGGRIIFTTLIPSPNQCEFGGTGWLMELDPFSGARLPFSPFDVDGDNDIDEADYVTITLGGVAVTIPVSGRKSEIGIMPRPTILDLPGLPELKFASGSLGSIARILEREAGKSGRLTWRQLR